MNLLVKEFTADVLSSAAEWMRSVVNCSFASRSSGNVFSASADDIPRTLRPSCWSSLKRDSVRALKILLTAAGEKIRCVGVALRTMHIASRPAP